MNISSIRARIEALTRRRAPVQLPANFIDPIAAMLRAQIKAGATPTPTTPARAASVKAELDARLAGLAARRRAWP